MKAVNLLPPELRSGPRRGRSASAPAPEAPGGAGPFLVLGALALCVLAMVAYVLAANTVTERQNELARVTADYETTARRAAALKPYGDFQDMALRRTQTVSSLAALRFDWEQALRDVSYAMPNTVTLTSLDGSISIDTGASSSPLRGEIPSPAITLKGCTKHQSAVATMLSRLRAIRGTTRVTLSKSERVDVTSSGQQAPPCGEGKVPQFEAVVFFERSGAGAGALSAAENPLPAAGATTPGATATPAAAGAPAAGGTPAAAGAPTSAATPTGGASGAQPASATATPAGTPAP